MHLTVVGLVLGFLSGLVAQAGRPSSKGASEKAYRQALSLLAAGDAVGAEASAREALSASIYFAPEQEIAVAPQKELLFEEMIGKARSAYRKRRGRYFLVLGEALSRQERWAEADKALRRAAVLSPASEPWRTLIANPHLETPAKVRLLLEAFFAAGADQQAVEEGLFRTGAFLNRDALRAVIDERLFSRTVAPKFAAPPAMEAWLAPFPEVRVVTDSGTLDSSEALRSGAALVIYLPARGCASCSEELDGISRAVGPERQRGKEIIVATLVEDQDLETARRIARLLAMDVEVGRAVRLPDALRGSPDGEIRLVARGGQLQIRLHLDERPRSREISRRLAACLELVLSNEEAEGRKPAEPSEKTGEESPLQRLEKLQRGPPSPKALYDMIDLTVPLEAGPAPLADVYRRIDGTLRTFVRQARGPEGVVAVLRRLARLRGAGRAKARALAAWDKDYRQKLVGAARDIEPGIDREALPEQGVFRLELSQDRVLLQRSFFDGDNLLHFHFLLETDGSGLNGLWAAPEAGIPAGGKLSAAGTIVFFEKDDGCGGLRLYGDGGELRYEGCSARLLGDAIVEEKEALVDTNAPAAGKAELPLYYRRAQIDPGGPAVFESPLESGLRLFKEGRYAEAAFAFEKAAEAIDPVAPYDEVDLRYNRARCLEEQGKVREALALFRSIGDATYQPLVEERLGIVEGAARR